MRLTCDRVFVAPGVGNWGTPDSRVGSQFSRSGHLPPRLLTLSPLDSSLVLLAQLLSQAVFTRQFNSLTQRRNNHWLHFHQACIFRLRVLNCSTVDAYTPSSATIRRLMRALTTYDRERRVLKILFHSPVSFRLLSTL